MLYFNAKKTEFKHHADIKFSEKTLKKRTEEGLQIIKGKVQEFCLMGLKKTNFTESYKPFFEITIKKGEEVVFSYDNVELENLQSVLKGVENLFSSGYDIHFDVIGFTLVVKHEDRENKIVVPCTDVNNVKMHQVARDFIRSSLKDDCTSEVLVRVNGAAEGAILNVYNMRLDLLETPLKNGDVVEVKPYVFVAKKRVKREEGEVQPKDKRTRHEASTADAPVIAPIQLEQSHERRIQCQGCENASHGFTCFKCGRNACVFHVFPYCAMHNSLRGCDEECKNRVTLCFNCLASGYENYTKNN